MHDTHGARTGRARNDRRHQLKLVRIAAGVIAVALLAAALTGCGLLSEKEADGNGGSGGTKKPTPAASQVETMTAGIGEAVTSGPWTVNVTKIERGRQYGLHIADEGTMLLVEVSLTNNEISDVLVEPRDFSLTDGENYTAALDGDPDYTPQATVEPGASATLKAVFYVPPYVEGKPLTFVFQNAARQMVRVEVRVP